MLLTYFSKIINLPFRELVAGYFTHAPLSRRVSHKGALCINKLIIINDKFVVYEHLFNLGAFHLGLLASSPYSNYPSLPLNASNRQFQRRFDRLGGQKN